MPILPTTGPSSADRSSRSPTDPGRGLIFYGDPHGNWEPLLAACDDAPPAGVILLGDNDLTMPLREQIAPVFAAGIPVWWIPGNHDAHNSDAFDRLWGDYPEGNLHARVVEIGGVKVAGLGGVFKGRIWNPDMAVPMHCSRADYLLHLPHTHRWRRGLPLRARDALFPEDFDAVSRMHADVLLTHEAPSTHEYGFAAIDRAAQACGARLIVHGHHHHSYVGRIACGLHVRGLAKAEVFRLHEKDLP